MVDLEKESIVIKVEVTNRQLRISGNLTRDWAHRLRNFNIRVGMQKAYAVNQLCIEHASNTVAASTSSHKCTYPMHGRYLYIEQNVANEVLTLCEVVVYGYFLN